MPRYISIMDSQRSKFFSDVKTFEEQGYKIYAASLRGISLPAGAPKEGLDVLSVTIKEVMATRI